ncbi:hypothetical protein TNCV_4630511 [Trichonephila clavipes]|nr:hypothetical protein TNCV_4630511 [Trichonephila clavipes]
MSSFLVLSEGDTRNRWREGQVCPDVGQGTMAPWARRLGREGRRRKKKRGDEKGEDGRERGEKERKKSRRERGARFVWRKGLSPEIGVKKTMNAGGVENRID